MKQLKPMLLATLLSAVTPPCLAVAINEIRIDQPGSDNDEYVELAGSPNEALADLAYLVIGDGSGVNDNGVIEAVVNLDGSALNENGFFVVSENTLSLGNSNLPANLNFENGDNVTHLLVKNFTGALNQDLDTNDDGALDVSPWSEIVDSVALVTSNLTTGDKIYSAVLAGPDGTFVPGHVFRQPDGAGPWQIGAFDPAGGDDTPGQANAGENPPPEMLSLSIPQIQGAGHLSPHQGKTVKTGGIVTAVAANGFYLQDAAGDGDPATSDAILVFTGSAPAVTAADKVEVEAVVSEFIPGGAATKNLSITELTAPKVTVLASLQALPAPVVIGESGLLPPNKIIDDDQLSDYQPTTDAIDFYEALEAMRVKVQDTRAVSPVSRFHEIFVVAERGRFANGVNQRGGITIQADDYNPERIQIQIDAHFLPGFEAAVNTGDRLGDVIGVVGYNFGNFEVLATEPFTVTPANLARETSELTGGKKQLTIASYNLLNLDPNDADGNADIANGQFAGIAEHIVRALQAPDIIALQEVQDNSGSVDDGTTDAATTYQTLIDAISAADGPHYRFADIAPDNNQDGGEPGGNIRLGFLYNPDRVALAENSLHRMTGEAFTDARKPLVAEFVFGRNKFTVINNHLTSKGGSTPIFGQIQPFINGGEDKRTTQAAIVRDYVAGLLESDPEANIIVLGDMNEFQFNRPLKTLKGEGAALLTDLVETLPLSDRYSYNFEGNAQALDHILVSPALAGRTEFDAVHVNTEFADQSSDHDPVLARVNLGKAKHSVRFATFNVSLNRSEAGQLIEDLSTPDNAQAKAVAEIIQRTSPDVILLNEFDYDPKGLAARLFQKNYLAVSQNGAKPVRYNRVYLAKVNTGIPSGLDLNRDGVVGGPDDAYGFGVFPGQYGMVLLSKYPIEKNKIRTFQHFLWKDMPGALLPDDPNTAAPGDWYSAAILDQFRLSSKSHWDIPLLILGNVVHVLISHPTPPVFDGPEDRNGTRNHDEIRFWADYVMPEKSDYIYDDKGQLGGLEEDAHFVIMGDMNADPVDGDSTANAIGQLLTLSMVNTSITPVSRGAVEASFIQGGANAVHKNAPTFDTADFADGAPGNLRADYVLPSRRLDIQAAGVFWPLHADSDFGLVGDFPFRSSDHRLVWVDVGNAFGRLDKKPKK